MSSFQPNRFMSLLFLAFAMLLTGCGRDSNSDNLKVDRITILHGADQNALPGEEFAEPIRIELESAATPGLLGGQGTRTPIGTSPVRIVPLDNSDLIVPAQVVTDPAGCAAIPVRAGKKVGDHYLKLVPENAPEKSVTIRLSTGIRLAGGGQQQKSGKTTTKPLSVTVVDATGKPASDVPVFFSLGTTPDGATPKARLLANAVRTDHNGNAATELVLGNRTGEYQVKVEVADPQRGLFWREKNIQVFGFNVAGVVIAVLGGLAIFVFGMKLMGDGLQKIAGENMKKILQFFARNGIVAVLAGTLVTAVIQASGATTVMVIGFINAGLLTLRQAIGIIFGANIGTTVTAQIISFNIAGVALPAITIGFLISLSRKPTVRGWGETILGFGLLFYGMNLMSDELKILGKFPAIFDFFRSFDCAPTTVGDFMPIGAILGAIGIGIIATVTIQSSSAAMGIVLALASGGLVNFYTSVPLLLGTNIGTTLTAFVASLAANRVAKQAAIAHSLFNVFGTIIMLVSFYIPYGADRIPIFLYFINAITPGNAFAAVPQGIERHIAMAHTFFNIAVTILLLPFIGTFTRLCEALLPVHSKHELAIEPLEPHLLATPSVALEQTVQVLRQMVSDAWNMVDIAIHHHFLNGKNDPESIERLAEAERGIDRTQTQITAYLVRITRRTLTHPQSELVPLLMHCNNDAERIADHTENILKLTKRMLEQDKHMSDSARHDLEKIWALLDEEAHHVISALGSTDADMVADALKSERKINKLTDKYETAHIDRLRKGKCNLAMSVIFIEMLGEMEKLGDHLSNIAERTPEIQKHYIKL